MNLQDLAHEQRNPCLTVKLWHKPRYTNKGNAIVKILFGQLCIGNVTIWKEAAFGNRISGPYFPNNGYRWFNPLKSVSPQFEDAVITALDAYEQNGKLFDLSSGKRESLPLEILSYEPAQNFEVGLQARFSVRYGGEIISDFEHINDGRHSVYYPRPWIDGSPQRCDFLNTRNDFRRQLSDALSTYLEASGIEANQTRSSYTRA